MTELDLDAIRARAEAATEEPWRAWLDERRPNERTATVETAYIRDSYDPELITDWCWDADAEFIAHARSDVPNLLTEVERLRAAVDVVRMVLKQHPTCDVHDDDAITCGWKTAVRDIQIALGDGNE